MPMIPVFKIFMMVVAIIMTVSCASNRDQSSSEKADSRYLYHQSLLALEGHNFIIEPGSELMFAHNDQNSGALKPGYANIVSGSGSFISLQGSQGVINFSQKFFPGKPSGLLSFKDDNAVMFKERSRNNSEICYYMKLSDNNDSMNKKDIVIILYENSNECFVKIYDGRTGDMHISFRGYVRQDCKD